MPEPVYAWREVAAPETEHMWHELGREAGVRHFPQRQVRTTTGGVRRWCRRVGVSVHDWCEWCGVKTIRESVALNPRWPLAATLGLILECRAWWAAERGEA